MTFLNVHIIQDFGTNAIQRGEFGEVKHVRTAEGLRQRVTPYPFKRAIRAALGVELGGYRLAQHLVPAFFVEKWEEQTGAVADGKIRAAAEVAFKKLFGFEHAKPKKTKEKGKGQGPDEAAVEAAAAEETAGEEDGNRGTVMQHVYHSELQRAIQFLSGGSIDEKDVRVPDAATSWFGRMLASDKERLHGVVGACRMGQATSATRITEQRDAWTAVPDGAKTALTLGDAAFTNSIMYRYASINLEEFAANMHADQATVAELHIVFLEQLIKALPSGARSNYNGVSLPSYVRVTIEDNENSGEAAFRGSRQVRNEDEARAALDTYLDRHLRAWVSTPHFQSHAGIGDDDPTFPDLIADAAAAIEHVLTSADTGGVAA